MKTRWWWALAWVGGATLVGILLSLVPRAGEFAHVLSYVALVGISFLASWAFVIAIVNLLLGVTLLIWPDNLLVISLNRHAGHAEALFAWTTLAAIAWPHFWFQLPALVAVIRLGPILIDEAAHRWRAVATHGDLARWRRPFFYLFTIVGLLLLNLLALAQWKTLLPLEAAVGVGLVIRGVAWALGKHGESRPTPRWDRLAIAVAIVLATVIPIYELIPAPTCPQQPLARGPATPMQTDIALFLMADTQLHELRGVRSAGHLDIVDRLVSVAVRPVELDLLSGVTFEHFVDLYKRKLQEHPTLRWAHLGDFADLGCRGEIVRFQKLLAPMPKALLAGASIGNHDGTFVGNFAWHPDWDSACPSGRLDRYSTHTGRLVGILRPLLARDAHLEIIQERPVATLGLLPRVAMPSVVVLGESGGRRILGVFLDTSDYAGLSIGAAGKQGEISALQFSWLLNQAAREPQASFVIFMHHPLDETTWSTRGRLATMSALLGPRLLAIVSAHEHRVEHHTPCLGGRVVDELLVGSTIDPPQQAAMLEIGPTALRVRTLPAVSAEAGVTAAECRDLIGKLPAAECSELVGNSDPTPESVQAHPRNPKQVKLAQQERARRLLRCICRDGACSPQAEPLDDPRVFDMIESVPRQNELVCLAWAASVLQAHKHEPGWSYARALRESFDVGGQPVVMEVDTQSTRQCR